MTIPNENYDLQKVEALLNFARAGSSGKSIPEQAAFFDVLNAEMDKSLPGLRENFEARQRGFMYGVSLQARRIYSSDQEQINQIAALRNEIKPKTPLLAKLFAKWGVLKIASEAAQKPEPDQTLTSQPPAP